MHGLMAEHLKCAGESAITWLTNITNDIVEFEVISDVLIQSKRVMERTH